jgi:transcriptional regulator with XRE-family HTH domain
MNLQKIFIANLKKNRQERGISQTALSRMCDTTTNYIGQIEMGRRIPSFEKIEQIAAALEIPSYQLFVFEAEEDKKEILNAKEYLGKMPKRVKNEIMSNILGAVTKDIKASFDSQRY